MVKAASLLLARLYPPTVDNSSFVVTGHHSSSLDKKIDFSQRDTCAFRVVDRSVAFWGWQFGFTCLLCR